MKINRFHSILSVKTFKAKRRAAGLLLAGALFMVSLFSAGCGRGTGSSGKPSGDGNDEALAMGRYVESEMTVPEEINGAFFSGGLYMSDKSELMLVDVNGSGVFCSKDLGESWERQDPVWYSDGKNAGYIWCIDIASDGAAAFVSAVHEDEEEPENADDILSRFSMSGYYYDSDGNKLNINMNAGAGLEMRELWFDGGKNLYAGDYDANIYRVDTATGDCTKFLDTADLGSVKEMFFVKDRIYTFDHYGNAMVWDKNTGGQIEDDALLTWLSKDKNAGSLNSNGGRSVIGCVDGDRLYFTASGGLYCYDTSKGLVELVIDARFSSLGDPSFSPVDVVKLPDDEFAVLYSGNTITLCRYKYDKDIPAVPNESVSVYSLRENYSMKQAISEYQKKNPGMYIRYEVGLSGDDPMTREDAIKLLNTSILSKEGPDIVLLDGLPAKSYIEKGMLSDVSGIEKELAAGGDELFSNIMEACRYDGKLYYIPLRVRLPMIVGAAGDIKDVDDLTSLADKVCALRKEKPEGSVIGLKTDEELLRLLSNVCEAAFLKDDGSLDKAVVEEFLTQAKRIRDAETAGYSPEKVDEYNGYFDDGFSWENYLAYASNEAIRIPMSGQKIGLGMIYQVDFDYDVLTAIRTKDNAIDFKAWKGQVKDGFSPAGMAGIVSGAEKKEEVKAFYRYLFTTEAQEETLDGFPVNTAAFDTLSACPRGEGDEMGLSCSDEDGKYFSLDIRWPDEEEFSVLKNIMLLAKNISSGDATVSGIVQRAGVKVLDGSMSIEDAMNEISEKTDIYLAE